MSELTTQKSRLQTEAGERWEMRRGNTSWVPKRGNWSKLKGQYLFGGKAIGITYNTASEIILKEENESSVKTKEREVDQKKKRLKISLGSHTFKINRTCHQKESKWQNWDWKSSPMAFRLAAHKFRLSAVR